MWPGIFGVEKYQIMIQLFIGLFKCFFKSFYADDQTLMTENEEELKSLLMVVKEESALM